MVMQKCPGRRSLGTTTHGRRRPSFSASASHPLDCGGILALERFRHPP